MLGVLLLFLLQFARIKALVGGLSGSVAVLFVTLIDVFAFAESLAASRDVAEAALTAVLPALALYLIVGRAFCGWICPMDFLYELVDRAKSRVRPSAGGERRQKGSGPSPRLGYLIAAGLLLISGIAGAPLFTAYLSHLTNFFRLLTTGVAAPLGLPMEPSVLVFSAGVIAALLLLELAFPRLWCRVLCPVGKTYGLFNNVSLLRLAVAGGTCEHCGLCDEKCYMQVNIAARTGAPSIRDGNCIYCGRCAEGCAAKGKTLALTFRRPK